MAHRVYNSEQWESGYYSPTSIPLPPDIVVMAFISSGTTVTDSETASIPSLPDIVATTEIV